jgi:hypothetical protein
VRALAAVSAGCVGSDRGRAGRWTERGIANRFSLTDSNGFSAQKHHRLWCKVIGDDSVRQLK